MSSRNRWFRTLPCAAILVASQLISGSLLAQGTNSPAPGPPAKTGMHTPGSDVSVPPLPPVAKPPVEFFRELLAMSLSERNQALANRTPEDRKLIVAKVREYQTLKPDQRELRLQATELSWYLVRLMRIPATNRPAQLEAIPVSTRKLVEDRLELWDNLRPEARKEFLEKQAAMKSFLELAASASQPANTNLSPERRAVLGKGIREIQAMSEDERQKLMSRFNQFFELTPQEKERALSTISEPERQQMEKTLRSFGQLTPDQRNRCIHSFEKFAGLSVAERNQFLKNAERWKLMTPDQREAWREVVSQMPMLPSADLGVPPMPKPARSRRVSPPVLTNGN